MLSTFLTSQADKSFDCIQVTAPLDTAAELSSLLSIAAQPGIRINLESLDTIQHFLVHGWADELLEHAGDEVLDEAVGACRTHICLAVLNAAERQAKLLRAPLGAPALQTVVGEHSVDHSTISLEAPQHIVGEELNGDDQQLVRAEPSSGETQNARITKAGSQRESASHVVSVS